ncbi:MAG: U32 family peptidase [Lactimicrobium sp.]|jgi:putative protease|uniref:peptidase U32 family protein n=1 Tax=Lactimicrobium sp. TaxID=2563780 RepID=UPI002F356286
MKKIELLAPAGNMDSLIAAVQAGCDAVYLGLTSYSARAFAGNFDKDQLIQAVHYCHVRNVRVYVTMNTMLYETEIERAKETVDFLYKNDVDALLIQDLGLFHLVHTMYPDFEIHCSTQMHIHNLAGVQVMKEEGASRVVLARESPIELVEKACQMGIDIEVFVYGAICISYSGQCLFSSAAKNRSANRGMCAQCCRLKYFPDDSHHFKEGDYILSPRDLNVIDQIPQLIKAGVASLKIEGRMKRPEYVYLVIKTFREAIDACLNGKPYHVSKQRQQELLEMFNRGFSKGHLFHDDVESRMGQYRPNHRGIQIGSVLSYGHGEVCVKLSAPLHQHDGLRILTSPQDIGLTAVKIFKKGKLVNSADKGDVISLPLHGKQMPKPGDPLQKTSDTVLLAKIDEEIAENERKVSLDAYYHAMPQEKLVLTLKDHDGHSITVQSDDVLQTAKKAPMHKEQIEASLSKTGDTCFVISSFNGEAGNVFIPVSQLNALRREALSKMEEVRAVLHVRSGAREYNVQLMQCVAPKDRILVEAHTDLDMNDVRIITQGNGLTPVINQDQMPGGELSDTVISQMGDFSCTLHNCIAGMTLNIANSYALAFVLSHPGIIGAVFSSECSNEQIHAVLDAFEKRYGFVPYTYELVYGRRVLMHIKDRFTSENIHSMQDLHGSVYPVRYNSSSTEIVENAPVHRANPYCYGSYVILDEWTRNPSAVKEEVHEEILGRI